jgi:hypothetical protein
MQFTLWSLVLFLTVPCWGASICSFSDLPLCAKPSATQRIQIDMCEADKVANNCDQWFEKHPEAQSKERKCDIIASCPMPAQIADYVKACSVGVVGAAGDFFTGIYDFVAGDVKILPVIKSRETYFSKCYSASCKYQMLGEYADLFSKEEIEGHPNTGNLDPADPANGNYLNGLSSKVLYNKLLEKLRNRAKGKSTTEEFIEPWSDKKASRQSVTDLTNGILAKAGLHNSACYDPAVVAEARCYAAAAVFDPIAASVAILKIRKLAGLRALESDVLHSRGEFGDVPLKPKKNLMAAADRKDAEARKYVRPSVVRTEELKRDVKGIWENDKLSSDEKLKQVFDKYSEMRIASLDPETQDLARRALSDVQVNGSPDNASWNLSEQKLSLGEFISENELAGYQTLAHEFEHLTQYPKAGRAPDVVHLEAMQEMMDKGLAFPNGPVSLHHSEFEAIGSQWDFLQVVPEQVRKNAVEAITKNTKIPADTKRMLIADIQNSTLSREDYIKKVPFQHKYSSYYELRNDAFRRKALLGVAVTAAGSTAGTGYGIYKGGQWIKSKVFDDGEDEPKK